MYGYYGYDTLFLAVIVVFILGIWAQIRVKNTYKKYSQEYASSGVTAANMAERMLSEHGSSVQVTMIPGSLTDNYNPRTGLVSLSQGTYGSTSVAALAVAAHEIGHVMQHQEGYIPIRIRNAILPAASIGSTAAPYIVILGAIMGSYNLAMIGVYLFLAMLIFQIVTLPVELNASSRALRMLEEGGYVTYEESDAAKRVLRAAAMTYVLAALASLVNFLRLLSLASRTRRND